MANLRLRYHLPSQIKKHVDFITPGVKLSRRPTRTRRAPLSKTFEKREIPTSTISPSEIKTFNTSTCGQAMIPDCIQALYKYPDATPADAQPGNELGIIEINATYVQDDMDLFFANVYPKIPRGTQAEKVLLDGAEMVTRQNKKEFVSSAIAILESNLDFQLAWPIVVRPRTSLGSRLQNQRLSLTDFETVASKHYPSGCQH